VIPFLFASVPPEPMPGEICREVFWEIAHSKFIKDHERVDLINRIDRICKNSVIITYPEVICDSSGLNCITDEKPMGEVFPPNGWYPWDTHRL
jgi:hypothetical protein